MDPATAFQTAGGIISVVGLIAKILKQFDEYRQTEGYFPKSLQTLATQLPYLRKLFEFHLGPGQNTSQTSTSKEIEVVIGDCKSILERLEEILNTLSLRPDDGGLDKMKKAITFTRKENKIQSIQADLDRQIGILNYGSSIECQMALATLKPPEPSNRIKLQKSYGFPSTKVSKFIGREKLLKDIELQLATESSQRQVLVLFGMGGSGKTQVALELCERRPVRHKFTTMLWIDAKSEDSTLQSFESFAYALYQDENSTRESASRIEVFKAMLEDLEEPALLVFDNFDSPSQFQSLRSFFPRNSKHAVIVTSRHGDCGHLGELLPIPAMEEEDAVELLMYKTGKNTGSDRIEQGQAIVERLGHLPLAIAQAGAFIRSRKLPLNEFLGHYNRRRSFILKDTPDIWEYGLNVFTTWEISLEQVSEDPVQRKQIQQFLVLSVLLYQGTVHQSRLECLRKRSSDSIHWEHIFCTNDRWDPDKYRDIISKLDRLSIVRILDSDKGQCDFTIHPMVCDWLRVRSHSLTPTQYMKWAMKVITAFMKSQNIQGSEGNLGRETELYIESCFRNFTEIGAAFTEDFLRSELLLDFRIRCATYLSQHGRPKLGASLYEECLASLGEDFGPQHQQFAHLLNNLGNNYASEGKYAEADRVFRLAIAAGSSHDACVNLGTCLFGQGQYEEARKMFEQALEIYKKNLGLQHPSTMNCQANLARTFHRQGDTAKASEMLTYVANMLKADVKPSPGTSLVMSVTYWVLGGVYGDMAEYDCAEEMYQHSLKHLGSLFGLECLRALPILEKLAQTYKRKNDLEKCELMFQKALICSESSNGSDHETTLLLCTRYAETLVSRKKFREAREYYSRVFSAWKSKHGLAHEQTVLSYLRLHDILYFQGEYSTMEAMCREVLTNFEIVLSRGHRLSRLLAHRLGWTLNLQDRYEEAISMFRQVIEHGQEGSSSTDDLALQAMDCIARVLSQQNRQSEAELVYRDELSIHVAVSGPESEQAVRCMAALTHCLLKQRPQSKLEEARQYIGNMQLIIKERSDMSIDTVKIVSRLAQSLALWSKYTPADAPLDSANMVAPIPVPAI